MLSADSMAAGCNSGVANFNGSGTVSRRFRVAFQKVAAKIVCFWLTP
jgi:hypothetical protein